VLQVPTAVRNEVMATLRAHGLSRHSHVIGKPNDRGVVEVWRDAKAQFQRAAARPAPGLGRVSWRIARLRDNPACADAEHAAAGAADDPGLHLHLSFDPAEDVAAPFIATGARRRWPSCASRASTRMSR
jgi:phosphoribosylformylglycinamidine synthase